MCENITKLIFDYTKNDKMADDYFVKQIIDIITKEKNIKDYIEKTTIILPFNNSNKSLGSAYNAKTKELQINLSPELKSIKYNISFFNNRNYRILLYNINVVLTILHELDHVEINKKMNIDEQIIDSVYGHLLFDIKNPKIIELTEEEFDALNDDEKKKIQNEFISSSIRICKNSLYYQLFHDKNPIERRANINSHLYLSQVLDNLDNTSLSNNALDKIRLLELKEFIKKCRYGYTSKGAITNSPSYDYIKTIQQEEALSKIDIYNSDCLIAYNNAKNTYTLQQRILYGLPLTINEFKEINMESNPFNAYKKKR